MHDSDKYQHLRIVGNWIPLSAVIALNSQDRGTLTLSIHRTWNAVIIMNNKSTLDDCFASGRIREGATVELANERVPSLLGRCRFCLYQLQSNSATTVVQYW